MNKVKKLKRIAPFSNGLGKALIIGAVGTGLILFLSYGVQFGVLLGADKQPALVLAAIDPKAGVTGSFAFALFLVIGNFVNSFMEEGLFRGVMLRHFRVALSFWRANFLQAALFGIWHLIWPLKQLIIGELDPGGAAVQAILLLIATSIYGFSIGYIYLKTDNLWAPWLLHTIINSMQNLIHIRTIDDLDSDVMIFQVVMILSSGDCCLVTKNQSGSVWI